MAFLHQHLEKVKFEAVALVAEFKRRGELDGHTSGLLSAELTKRIKPDPGGGAGERQSRG